jgi:uncharacterized protein HemY
VRERSGDYTAARSEAETSLKLAPNVDAYLVLARIDLQQKNLPQSASDVQSALRVEPKNPAALGMKQALESRGQQVQP